MNALLLAEFYRTRRRACEDLVVNARVVMYVTRPYLAAAHARKARECTHTDGRMHRMKELLRIDNHHLLWRVES